MSRASTVTLKHIRLKPVNNASITEAILSFNFVSKLTFASTSSSSTYLQTITDSQPKSFSNPLYGFLPQTLNPNNIVNLVCSRLNRDGHDFTLLRKDIQGLIPHLGNHELSRVLLRCQSDSSKALSFFSLVKNDLGLKPNNYNYCIVVHILAWSRKFSQAMVVLSELIELNRDVSQSGDIFQSLVLCTNECNWNPVIFDMLTKAYVKMGMVQEGLMSFRKTVMLGLVPTVVTSNCLLNGVLKLNRVDWCWDVYEEMGRIGMHPNSCTFNILIHALCKDGNVERVNKFLYEMEEEGFDPDIVTYNTLIDSYCKKGRLNDAFYLYRVMYRRGVMPDLFSYTALMNGLCREGKVREAHQLFHQMVHRGLIPDIISYNTLICNYCKEGMMQESRSLLHDMIGAGVFPDNFTCWMLVEGYVKKGRLLSALNLVVELHRFGVPISQDIYNYLIVALCREDRPFAAKNLLERMSEDGHEPNVEIYNEVIDSLCNCNPNEALLLKTEMVFKDVKPNLVTYRALIVCLCRLKRSVKGESLMREMVESGMQPDILICRALVSGFCRECNLVKAESLLRFFAEEFQIYDTECFNSLVGAFLQDGDVSKLMELQDSLLKLGFAPNGQTCKYVIDGLCKATRNPKNMLYESEGNN